MDKKSLFNSLLNVAKVATPAIVTESVYEKMFNHHFFSFKPLWFTMDDYKDLTRERHTFYSYSKNKLVGYIYQTKTGKKKGIFVFAHGYGGGGHHCYLDLIHAICEQGYYVFAYDATANDESEGHTMKGFTQGLLDADKAINYVEMLKEYQKLPLYLCGHSWGAYSVSASIGWHPRVKGLIAFSGFNQSTTIFKANGERYAGEKANDFMIYVDTLEKLLFGDIYETTAINAFHNTKAKICIIHSEDDNTVPIDAGFNLYKKEFRNDKRFKFIKLLSRGHGTVYYTLEGKKYFDKINKGYESYIKKEKPDDKQKEQYLKEHIDRSRYTDMVDKDLLNKAIKFITK